KLVNTATGGAEPSANAERPSSNRAKNTAMVRGFTWPQMTPWSISEEEGGAPGSRPWPGLLVIRTATVVDGLAFQGLQRFGRLHAPVSVRFNRNLAALGVVGDDQIPDVLKRSPENLRAGEHRVSHGPGGAVVV